MEIDLNSYGDTWRVNNFFARQVDYKSLSIYSSPHYPADLSISSHHQDGYHPHRWLPVAYDLHCTWSIRIMLKFSSKTNLEHQWCVLHGQRFRQLNTPNFKLLDSGRSSFICAQGKRSEKRWNFCCITILSDMHFFPPLSFNRKPKKKLFIKGYIFPVRFTKRLDRSDCLIRLQAPGFWPNVR